MDTFVDATSPKFAAQALRRVNNLGWRPLHLLNGASASVGSVLVPAGLDKAIGVITGLYLKDPTDSRWSRDLGMVEWVSFMKAYYPDGDLTDNSNVYGYAAARTLVHVLKECGNDLSRENVMRHAAALSDFDTGVSMPGIKVTTGANDYAPFKALQLGRFDGRTWVPFGETLSR